MKKILIVSLLVFFIAGQAFGATPGYRQSPGVGNIPDQGGQQSDPPKTFRMVRFVQSAHQADNITPDTLVIWQTLSEDDGVTVTTSNLSQDGRIAGVVVANGLTQETNGNTVAEDVGKRNWTWLQTYGVAEVTMSTGAKGLTGARLGIGTTNLGTAGTFTPDTDNYGSTQFGDGGFFMEDGSWSETDVTVFLQCQ